MQASHVIKPQACPPEIDRTWKYDESSIPCKWQSQQARKILRLVPRDRFRLYPTGKCYFEQPSCDPEEIFRFWSLVLLFTRKHRLAFISTNAAFFASASTARRHARPWIDVAAGSIFFKSFGVHDHHSISFLCLHTQDRKVMDNSVVHSYHVPISNS